VVVFGKQQETVERVGPEVDVDVELSLSGRRRPTKHYEPGRREQGILDHNVCARPTTAYTAVINSKSSFQTEIFTNLGLYSYTRRQQVQFSCNLYMALNSLHRESKNDTKLPQMLLTIYSLVNLQQILCLNIPPHLTYVATLPCKI